MHQKKIGKKPGNVYAHMKLYLWEYRTWFVLPTILALSGILFPTAHTSSYCPLMTESLHVYLITATSNGQTSPVASLSFHLLWI